MAERFTPRYYGLVFGYRKSFVDNCGELLDIDNNIITVKTDSGDIKHLLNTIVKVLNACDDCILTYHDGEQDQGCEYNGRHYHAVAKLRCHPTRDSRWGREALAFCRARSELIFFACQVVVNLGALSRHICQAPRICKMVKGAMTSEISLRPGESLEPIADKRAKLRKDPAYYRIEFLTKLMEKYRTSDMPTIKRKAVMNQSEWSEFVECLAGSGFDVQYKKAVDIYRTLTCTKTFKMLMETDNCGEWHSNEYLSVIESLDVFRKWLQLQQFDANEFLDNLFGILEKKTPKVNTFCLHGPPNSGKSFILRSIVPHYSYFGEVRGGGSNYTFLWQDCIDTGVIFIEEPMITPEIAEQFKLVLEGAPTHVHVKMRGDAVLQPTPVLITTNSLLWRWCNSEMAAFQARMRSYNCTEAPFLKDIKKTN